MTADILHIGHIKFLEECSSKCDCLIVGVMTDECVKKYKKTYPILTYKERMRIVNSLDMVDTVVPQDTFEMIKNIKRYKPDIVFDSTNHDRKLTYKYARKQGCRVTKIPYSDEQSSTKIKEKIYATRLVAEANELQNIIAPNPTYKYFS